MKAAHIKCFGFQFHSKVKSHMYLHTTNRFHVVLVFQWGSSLLIKKWQGFIQVILEIFIGASIL